LGAGHVARSAMLLALVFACFLEGVFDDAAA
jgi:hypothetical protein